MHEIVIEAGKRVESADREQKIRDMENLLGRIAHLQGEIVAIQEKIAQHQKVLKEIDFTPMKVSTLLGD